MKEVITYATTVKLSNEACNRAWDDGCIVAKNIVGDMDLLYESIKTYDTVYLQYIEEFGKGYDDLFPILEHMKMNNITLKLRDWELDPMYIGYDCVVKSLRDSKEYTQVMISRYITKGMIDAKELNFRNRMGRPKRRLPMTEICRMRRQGFGLNTIAKRLNLPYSTLYRRQNDINLNIERGVGL